jgi:hypothetical protein
MNTKLTRNIIEHILCGLGVLMSTDFADVNSIISKEYKLPFQLIFDDGDKKDIWGCQILSNQQEISILIGDCSDDIKQYCGVIQLKNSPAYGIYFLDDENEMPLIACSLNSKDWMYCNTYLQATFLAGMEQIKDLGLAWHSITEYEDQHKLLLSFIEYYHNFCGGDE